MDFMDILPDERLLIRPPLIACGEDTPRNGDSIDAIAVIASEAKQSRAASAEAKAGLLRRKGSSQ
jgi:hypothetical protein